MRAAVTPLFSKWIAFAGLPWSHRPGIAARARIDQEIALSRYLISTLAEYQTEFWVIVGQALRQRGAEVHFVSFDSRSNELLARAGLPFFDATASAVAARLGDEDPLAVCHRFGIADPLPWLTHEKFAFGLRDSDALVRKLAGILLVVDDAVKDIAHPVSVVQELGGFLSVLGTHFAAKARGLASWFIEPSFFRSRLLFIEGSLAAFHHPGDARAKPEGAVAQYLDETTRQNLIVIPEKDRHQYTTAFRKVVNLRNMRRLTEKMIDKYLLKKEQEFGHIGSHVFTHARMIAASRKLARHYTPLDEAQPFVYYPLHVPGDVALTLRSPDYLDQIAVIDYLCRVTPLRYKVAVKEHPAMIGAMGSEPLISLKARYDRFVILPPSTNNFDVLRRAEAVVTVNSKSGAEAGLLGRNVLVLGDAFYRDAPFARAMGKLADIATALPQALELSDRPADPSATLQYFAAFWPSTWPGELYVGDNGNPELFADSLLEATAAVDHPNGKA